MTENHPDKKSFDIIWENIIEKEIELYAKRYWSLIKLIPFAKEAVWEKYCSLNKHCKNVYMINPDGKLDRHKVAACYLCSIALEKPIRIKQQENKTKNDDLYYVINERLAITTGLSILRGFLESSIRTTYKDDEGKMNELLLKIKDGIKIPNDEEIHHGAYLDNFASEIYYATKEGKLHVLSIAHELYLLELLTLGRKIKG